MLIVCSCFRRSRRSLFRSVRCEGRGGGSEGEDNRDEAGRSESSRFLREVGDEVEDNGRVDGRLDRRVCLCNWGVAGGDYVLLALFIHI